MSNLTYEIVLRVPAASLSRILGDDAISTCIQSFKRVEEEAAPKPRVTRYANGKRSKGISGRELALQVLGSAKRAFGLTELKNNFQAKGFAPNSVTPVLSILVAEKKVKNIGLGLYALPGVPAK